MCCGWRSAGQRQPGADIALVYHSDRGSVAGSAIVLSPPSGARGPARRLTPIRVRPRSNT